MSYRFKLLDNGLMVLPIRSVFPWVFAVWIVSLKMSTFFYEILCSFQVFFFVSDAIKFNEAHLHNLMPRRDMLFIMSKNTADQIGILQCDIKQIPFPCCLIMCCCSFIEMSGII